MTNQTTTYTVRFRRNGETWEYLTGVVNRKGIAWLLNSAAFRFGKLTPFQVFDADGELVVDYVWASI